MNIDARETYKAFVVAYITTHQYTDKRGYFSRLLGIPREDAKLLCYRIAYKGATEYEWR